MHAPSILTAAAAAALLGAAAAFPAPELDDASAPEVTEGPVLVVPRADVTAPWVRMDDEGQPAETLTPSITTKEDGSTEVVDAAPHDVTASVFTQTYYGRVSTSTGEPPIPSATNKHGEGGFARCYNKDGDNAPLCDPTPSATMFQGSIYYVTWDPDYFDSKDLPKNTTRQVSVRLDYLNRTSEKEAPDYSNSDDFEDHDFVKLDQTKPVPADWGVYALKISKKYLKGPRPHNITLTLLGGDSQSDGVDKVTDPIPLVLDQHRAPAEDDNKIENRDIVIALPVVFGSIIFLLIGICIWNRKTRRIDVGNIMGRSNRGYTGRRVRRLFRGGDKPGDPRGELLGAGSIRLEDRAHASPLYEYSDYTDPTAPPPPPPPGRRDSDLGSLAGSPVTPGFRDEDTSGANAFRDELRRQEDERRAGRI